MSIINRMKITNQQAINPDYLLIHVTIDGHRKYTLSLETGSHNGYEDRRRQMVRNITKTLQEIIDEHAKPRPLWERIVAKWNNYMDKS